MKLNKISSILASALLLGAASCSEYTPTGYEEVAALAGAQVQSPVVDGVANHDVTINWTIPADADITGCILYRDAVQIEEFGLTADRSYSYKALGTPLGQEVVYTVKVRYENGSLSTGKSVSVELPAETFAGVSGLKGEVSGRKVILSWTLPSQKFLTGVRILLNGDPNSAINLPADATTYTFKGQAMDTELNYSVEALYDTYYASPAEDYKTMIPYYEPTMAFLLPADVADAASLPDDDELAAAAWFAAQPNAVFVHPSDLPNLDSDVCGVLWVMVDRVGLPYGWQNLPGEIGSDATIAALRNYSANGGSIYLSNMAVQLTVPLQMVPENMNPGIFGNGDGGSGNDFWVLNAYLGWDFQNGSDQGFYDRTGHAIYKDLIFEDPNGYGYANLPLIGPGQREDHNCMWDCNIWGRGNQRDVIAHFEVETNSLVLATWGHVRDHCVAGIVDFYPNDVHGRCIANGLAAYEWNQNSGVNVYQHNVEQLTQNILDYLK